jgi:hypothetical protein
LKSDHTETAGKCLKPLVFSPCSRRLLAIGGGVHVDDALAQAEESVTVLGQESG